MNNPYHVPRELLSKYAKAGPRYTSYPTAPIWSNSFGPEDALSIYRENNASGKEPLALYIHLPFCTSLCWYCGCNVKISRDKSVLGPYLHALERELKAVAAHLSEGRFLSQMHWGGGTPTYLNPEQIQELVALVRRYIPFEEGAELSIEVDPRVTTLAHLEALRASGFNRISMGIQDFNPEVQAAVHRIQSFEATTELIANSRRLGFESINVDLMYGLPLQTVASFADTLALVDQLNPDRLALFHYAHMPWLKPAQKLISDDAIPSSDVKLDIFESAIDHFIETGYRYIGMDHFARPDDTLTLAQDNHTLRRNFMGYTTQAGVDLYGLGVSSISEIDGHFIQNQRLVPDYQSALESGSLPTVRGMRLSQDDHLRKAVIEQLICNNYLDFKGISERFEVDFKRYFSKEIEHSKRLQDDALLEVGADFIRIQPRGQILIRNICMLWDAYLKSSDTVYSQTV